MTAKSKILIVDDDPVLRRTLGDILKIKGYDLADVPGGKIAVLELMKEKPAVALIDLKLPDMDGLELIRQIRDQSPGTECIVLTGFASQASAIEAVNLGAYSYVQKPYDVEQLLLTIRRAIEKRQAEEALRESEEVYRTLVMTAPDAVIACDLEGIITYASQRTLELQGSENAERLSGLSIFELLIPEDRQRARESFQTALTSGIVRDLEFHMLKESGTQFAIEISAALIKDAYGKPKGYIAAARDITIRKRRDRELQALSGLAVALRTAQTRSDIITIILNEVLELLSVNSAALVLGDVLTSNDPASANTMLVEQGRGDWAHTTGEVLSINDCVVRREGVVRHTNPLDPARSIPGVAIPSIFNGPFAIAGIPLIAQSLTIGAMYVGREEKITAEELRVLSAIGDLAANAIYRTSLFEQTQLRLQRLDSLRIVDTSINGSMDMRTTLTVLLDQLTSQLNVAAASIYLFHSSTQMLEHIVDRGFQTHTTHRAFQRLSNSPAGQALLERRILYIPNPEFRKADGGSKEGAAAENAYAAELFLARGLAEEKFSAYHAIPLITKGQLKGVLELFHRQQPRITLEWMDFLETMAGQAAITIDNALLFEGLEKSKTELELAYDTTLEGWVRTLDMRDQEIEGHTRRVTEMTMRLARAMDLQEDALVQVRRGALLHDIGKMAIPDSILRKPGPLTEDEWQIMRRHPDYAFDLLMPIAYLQPAIDIPYCHHELWNGTGYPRGLKGNSIPLAARIFSVVDVWDALQNDRPYRKGWPLDKIVEYLRHESGRLFDPTVISAFLPLLEA